MTGNIGKESTRIIALVATSLLCGLPGLAGLCLGPLTVMGSLLPDNNIDPADTALVIGMGISLTCLSIGFVAIPVLVGYLTRKGKKPKPIDSNEPIPEDDF